MKNFLLAVFTIFTFVAFSQAPQGINYQGIARNTSGTVLASQAISIKFELHQGSAAGSIVFNEIHNMTTNPFGLFTLSIGSVNTTGFASINWGGGPYFLETSIDPTGGSAFTSLGTQQFMSVPYALYAQTSGNASPTPTITINAPNTVSGSAGSYSINVPAATAYTGGTGINVAGNTIINTAPNQTVNISGSGVTGTYPNYTVTSAVSPTTTLVNGNNITLNQSANTYTVNAPSYSLTQAGNTIDLLQNGASIGTATLPTVTNYVAGSDIAITSGSIINTAPDQTVTLNAVGATTVTGTYPSFTINTPTAQTYTAGSDIAITSGSIINTAPDQTVTLNAAGATTITGTYPSFTINTPTTQAYSAGTGIDISATGVITNTATAVTPTITGSNLAVVTPTSGNTFNVDVPVPSLNYNTTGNILTLTQGTVTTSAALTGTGASTINMTGAGVANVSPTSGSAFTVTVPSPTFTANGPTTITGTYPNLTINSTASPSTTLVQGNNVTLNNSGNTYTVSSVTPTLNVIGGSISGAYPSQTITIPAGTTYVGTTNNITVTSNTINLATTGITTGSYGFNTSNAVPTFSVDNFGRLTTASQYTPNILGDVVGSINTSTVTRIRGTNISAAAPTANQVLQFNAGSWTPSTLTASTTILTQSTGIIVTGTAPNYTISSPPQALSLSGTTLTSGPATNSVNLATLPGLWSTVSSTNITTTNSLSLVGIGTGTTSPSYKLDVYGTGSVPATIHGYNSGATVSSTGVFGENPNNGIGVYGQSNSGQGVWGKSTSNAGIYGESVSGDAGKFLMTGTGPSFGVQVQTNGTGAALYAKTTNTAATALAAKFDGHSWLSGKVRIDSSLTMAAYNSPPNVSIIQEGRIYYDRPSNKFKVSENGGAYVNLIGGSSPWIQGVGTTTLTNINDQVGIGTNAPASLLDIRSTATSTLISAPILNISNTHNTYATPNGLVNIENLAGSGAALYVKNQTSGDGITTVLTNTSSSGTGVSSTISGLGNAGYFAVNNILSNAAGIEARIINGTPSSSAIKVFNTGPSGNAAVFALSNSSNSQAALSLINGGQGQGGYFENNNASNFSSAIYSQSNGNGSTIRAINTNTTNSGAFAIHASTDYGVVIRAQGLSATNNVIQATNTNGTNTATTILASNSGNGNAMDAQATNGTALNATNSSSLMTIYAYNGGSGDVIQAFGGTGRGINATNTSNIVPTAQFYNDGTSGSLLVTKNAGTTAGNVASFSNVSASNASDAVVISNSGAGSALVVNGKVRIADATQGLGKVLTSDASGNASWQAASGGSAWSLSGNALSGSEFFGSTNAQDVIFRSNGTELMRLKNNNAITFTAGQYSMTASTSGNPAFTLTGPNFLSTQINLKTTTAVTATGANLGSLSFSDGTNSTSQAFIQGMRDATSSGASDLPTALVFYTTTDGSGTEAERMRISNSGRVGIGTTAPTGMLHIQSPATNTVALLVQDGHMKSSQTTPPTVSTFSVSGGPSSATYTLTTGTDVKGSLLAVVTTTGMINAGGQVTMRVQFNKAYAVNPTVVITPTSDFGLLSYYVSAVAPGSFNLTIKNNTATNIGGTTQSFSFNYFVIE